MSKFRLLDLGHGRNKSVLFPAIVVGVATLGIATNQYIAALRAPELSVTTKTIEFGDVLDGVMVNRSFHIINKYATNAHIESIFTTCGCTTASSLHDIAPHNGADLRVVFNSKSRSGEVRKGVVITYSLGLQRHKTLLCILHGRVVPNVVLESSTGIEFGTVLPGASVQKNFKISSGDGKPLNIRSIIIANGQDCHLSVKPLQSSGLSCTLLVKMTASRIAKAYTPYCTIVFADGRPSFDIATDVLVKSAYKMSSRSVSYGLAESGQNVTKSILISCPYTNLPKIIHKPENVNAKLSGKGGEWLLTTVWHVPSAANVPINDQIDLFFGNVNEPILRVPVYGVSNKG